MRTIVPLLFFLSLLAGCAPHNGHGPGVTVWENGAARVIPADRFNEAAFLGRGFYRTVDGTGRPLYVRITENDKPRDVTFIAGSGSGKERSFGGLGGQFTGVRSLTGAPAGRR